MRKLALFFMLFFLASPNAAADGGPVYDKMCMPYEDMVKGLSDVWNETLVWRGLSSNGTIIEIFTSQSPTWTIQETFPDGISCERGRGKHWEISLPNSV